ncbi:hypothetical protein RMCBS344292_19013 [Rhizopus microsporus]|nr:hypothetical protein RMCBS344292_19013 [Rhizopus microsporus]
MRSIIISNYDGSPIKEYKGCWKQAFKKACNHLSLLVARDDNSPLSVISASVTGSSCTPTSSLSYQRKLSSADFTIIADNYNKITKKWTLKTGRNVEDKSTRDFIYEHPTHSFILDINDPVWKNYFSNEELLEVKANASLSDSNKDLPVNLQDMIWRLNRKTTFRDIHDVFNAIQADPVNNAEEFWLSKDLLDGVYGFIKKSSRLSGTSAQGGKESIVLVNIKTCIEQLHPSVKCQNSWHNHPRISALKMSFKHGSVLLLSSSSRLHMQESVYEIPQFLFPVLKFVYNLN